MITDIDKHSDDRSIPSINRHDALAHENIMAKGTNSTNYITPGTNQSDIAAAKNGQFTIVQTGILTLGSVLGLANSPGAGTFGAFRTVLVASVPHNLTFIPIVTGSVLSTSGNTFIQMPYGDAVYDAPTTSALWQTIEFGADANNIYVLTNGMVWGGGWSLAAGWSFKYFAQQQTSN